jgi:hypothetical protein
MCQPPLTCQDIDVAHLKPISETDNWVLLRHIPDALRDHAGLIHRWVGSMRNRR